MKIACAAAMIYAVLLGGCLCQPVSAQTFQDACDSLRLDAVRTYDGFSEPIYNFGEFSMWGASEDETVLPMQRGRRDASVVYQIQGGERISASIYALNGTLAYPDKQDRLLRGLFSLQASPAQRSFYDTARDVLFARRNGATYRLYLLRSGYYFLPGETAGGMSERYFGLNFEVSSDGREFVPLSRMRIMQVRSQMLEEYTGSYCWESYEAEVPPRTEFIRVSLQGFNKIPGSSMPDQPMVENELLLANVEIQGGKLTIGPPNSSSNAPSEEPSGPEEPAPSEIPSSSESPSSSAPSSSSGEPSSSLLPSSSLPSSSSDAPPLSSQPGPSLQEPGSNGSPDDEAAPPSKEKSIPAKQRPRSTVGVPQVHSGPRSTAPARSDSLEPETNSAKSRTSASEDRESLRGTAASAERTGGSAMTKASSAVPTPVWTGLVWGCASAAVFVWRMRR